jgi:molybdopterin/thiamine biosynthesis adenylyltransferase
MKIRTDCILKNKDNVYFLTNEEDAVSLGEIGSDIIFKLTEAREKEVDLEKYLNEDVIRNLIKYRFIVFEKNNIKDILERTQYKWFSYHSSDKTWEEYRNVKITILGCGGTGCLITQSLAASGIKNFTLIDFDRIALSNINRQFTYHRSDIGNSKTEKLKQLLYDDYRVKNVKIIDSYIETSDLLISKTSETDLLICCADKPSHAIHLLCAEYCIKTNTPVLYGAVGFMNGTIGPLLYGKRAAMKFKKVCSLVAPVIKNRTWETIFPSNSATNSVIANLMAFETIMFFTSRKRCKLINSCMNVNFSTLEITKGYIIK